MTPRVTSLFLVVLFSFAACSKGADLLTQVPAGAKAVLLVRDIPTLEKDIRAFAAKLNLPIPPEAIDINQALGLVGLNGRLGKQAAIVVTDATPAGVTIVVEFEKIAEVLESPGVEKTDEDGIYSVDVMDMTGKVLVKDNVAFIQLYVDDADGLKPFQKIEKSFAQSMTSDDQKLLASNDLFFTIDVAQWREAAIQGLDLLSEQMKNTIDQAEEDDDAEGQGPAVDQAKAALEGVKMYLDAARALVRDTKTVSGGIDASADRITLRTSAHFEPDSELAKSFPPGGRPTTDFFQSMPNRPFLFAGGADMKTFGRLMRSFSEVGARMTASLGAKEKIDPKMLADAMAYMDKVDVTAGMMSFGDDDAGMSVLGFMASADPAGLLAETKKQFANSNKMLGALYGVGTFGDLKEKKVGGKDVLDVSVDMSAITKAMGPAAAAPGAPDMQQMFSAIFGTDDGKMTYQLRADPKAVVYAMAGVEDPITLLDAGEPLAKSDRLKPIFDSLPKQSAAAFALDITDYFNMFGRISKVMGGPVAFPKMDDAGKTTPIGVAITTGKDQANLDLVIPADHVAAIAAYVMQMGAMFGAPGLPVPPPAEPAPDF